LGIKGEEFKLNDLVKSRGVADRRDGIVHPFESGTMNNRIAMAVTLGQSWGF
jgi:hypothetical protein